jgi:nucleoside-diphosphate-sugar epimerase
MRSGSAPADDRAEGALSAPSGEPVRGVCAITGASGYVGSRVAMYLARDGWEIRALSRQRPREKHIDAQVHFELGGDVTPEALAGARALVHVAYDFSAVRWRDIARVNIEGSRRLFAAARDANIDRIVLMSTVAAFPGARSLYGRAKLEIERAALEVNATVVRPGLVWGHQGAAMFGALQRTVRRLRVVPLLVPGERQFRLVHEDDLAALVASILNWWPVGSGKLYVAAADEPTAFIELLRSLASQTSERPRFVRLPWRAVWLVMRMLEACGASLPFRSDSLVSLAAIDDDPLSRATDHAARYGVRFRPYALPELA